MDPDPDPDPDLTIVLLGKAGVGKSASGNTILGQEVFESSPWFASVTEEIYVETGGVFGKQISVVDTPGILDSKETTENIQNYCQNLLKSNKPCLFLVALSIGKFTKEDQEAVDEAKRVLGDQGLKNSYLLFTNGDQLQGGSLTEFIFADKEGKLPDVVRMFSGAFHLFNNRDGDQKQVRDLLVKTGYLRDHQPLDPAHLFCSVWDPDPDLTIVLLGKAEVGKSASGNTILGRAVFKSDFSSTSGTKEICVETGRVFEKRISVVDTPGILNSKKTTENIKNYCQNLLRSNKPCLFLVVLSIGRFTEEDQEAVDEAKRVLGDHGLKKSYLLFTNGDKLKGRSLTEFIFADKEGKLVDVVRMFSGACQLFNNEDGDQEQVRDLLLKTRNLGDHQPLDPAHLFCSVMDPDPDPDPDLTIVLLGKAGVGKSASGNTILGRKVFESDPFFASVTKEIHVETGRVFEKQISVVDTPGILDSKKTTENTKNYCQNLLKSNKPCVFLVVLSIGKFTKEDQKAVTAAKRVLGDQGLKKSYLLFTYGDKLKGRSLTEFIFVDKEGKLVDVVRMFSGACQLFNNEDGDQKQVRDLLLKTRNLRDHQPLDPAHLFCSVMDPDPDRDLTIVLLGKAGVGKSASGNTILGRAAFRSDFSFTSVTKEICVETGRVFGKQISVVDTPGILDSEETTEDIKNYCQHLLKSNKPCLFLVVLSIRKFTKEDQKAVDTAKRVLGDQGLKNSYLLFTNGDKLQGRSFTDFIFADKEGKLPDAVRMFSGAFHLFNNEDGDQEQVQDLLLKTGYLRDHQPLDPAAGLEVQRRIVLLGLPGVGKSSSGNTILGSEKFKSGFTFNSVSPECVSESASVDGQMIQVVDTPGFTDEVLDPEQLYEEIMKTLVKARPGPHAFIIVVRLGRVSTADKKLFELLPKLFGGDASKYTMVLFTHGDGLRGRSMDQLILSNRYVSDLVSMCDGRYCVFDNTQRGRKLQVRDLLNKIDGMVEANGGEHYTSDMFRMAETFIREERNRADQSDDRNRPRPPAYTNRPRQSDDRNSCRIF